jgi:hypothetical protein
MCQSRITGEPQSAAYVAMFRDIPKPTLYRWMQRGDLPYEDYGGLTDRHISIEDTMRVKAAKRPGRPKKRDAERVRNRTVNYEFGRADRKGRGGEDRHQL